MVEDLTDSSLSAVMKFKATGMVPGDELEIKINGETIAANHLERRFNADGRPAAADRPLAAFYQYRLNLSSPPAKFGDNQLSASLVKSVGKERVNILEMAIEVRNGK